MRAAFRYSLLFFLLVFAGPQAFCQPGQLQFTHVDISDGLSHNQVNCILKDDQGFLWFGTSSGLSRYDGYSFKIFRHQQDDSLSLTDNYITGIFPLPGGRLWIGTRTQSDIYNPATERFDSGVTAYLRSLALPAAKINSIRRDKRGRYWFLYADSGLCRYDPSSGASTRFVAGLGAAGSRTTVSDVAFDSSGAVWMAGANGMLVQADAGTGAVLYRNDSLTRVFPGGAAWRIFCDSDGDVWMYASGESAGLYYFDTHRRHFRHLSKSARSCRLNNDIVYAVTQNSNGVVWIGTDHGGIDLVSKKDFSVRYLMHNPEDPRSLAQNSIYALYKDNTGIIWVGTYKKGVCYYKEIFNRFPLYSHDPNIARGKDGTFKSLPYQDVDRFVEDARGNLWIGTNGGGLIYFDRKHNTFTQYLHDPSRPNSLCNNVIVGLCLDSRGRLWIGTYTGGLDCFDGRTFVHYRHKDNDPASLSNDNVWDIYEDSARRLWIGTMGGGLDRLDARTNTFIHYNRYLTKVDGASYVMEILQDPSGRLWLGTAGGVDVLDPSTGRVRYFGHDPRDPASLCNNNINAIYRDSRGWIWVGTRDGLSRLDPATGKFRNFSTRDGLPDNTVLTILEDRSHRLWMSTSNGLSCLSIGARDGSPTFTFKNYDESDGLQGREFNQKSAFRTREGLLIFGGAGGFNMFDPSRIRISRAVPPVVFTDLQVFNKSVGIGESIGGQVILSRAITGARSITLPYGANDFSLVFASLAYGHSAKNRYAYRLDGFNTDWIVAGGGAHKATYTNLDPGRYVFRVRAANHDGIWGDQQAVLDITVLPPFWRTTWAYLVYALLIAAALYLARAVLLYRARMNFRMQQQQREAQRMHELDMMKIRFFTNISHEFRTPLTLILTPVEKMLKQAGDSQHKNQLQLVQRNARRLLHLVNQLLDFRKMEVQEIRLNARPSDIIAFISEVVSSFSDVAEKKNIDFTLETATASATASFDTDKLERILFNLLSNAFKFTPEGGAITLRLDTVAQSGRQNGVPYLRIRVEDNGIGIPAEKQNHIFDRFFQLKTPYSTANAGSGIGLSITREFVRLHGGTIEVASEPGKGSCFTVLLPLQPGDAASSVPPSPLAVPAITSLLHPVTPANAAKYSGRKRTILLVEDNEDFRFYLKDNLSVHFNVLEARTGREGWEKALAEKPDLIVSDIMMREMNGIELSRKLKKDPRTARIPLILLTARASEEQKLEGYEAGANDYITKPFNFEILLARIHNLLAEEKLQHKAEKPKVSLELPDPRISSAEERFLENAFAIVEKNMGDPQFSVEQLSQALYVSRVTLYKKITEMTGKSPVAFIRGIRVRRAAQLLTTSRMSVSQAAYEVGFNNPKYFTRHFKEIYGMLPSEYAKHDREAAAGKQQQH
jgi:signal transduction histidine kinase/ligand-binding sensor domain-containing protein/DNA-binding response OmpR family regulator